MNNTALAVGITGGIGSGKTLVTRLFKLLGIPVYNADAEAKKLMQQELKEPLINTFGTNSFKGSKLNREFLAQKVFNHPKELAKLNKIVHPAVAKHYSIWQTTHTHVPYTLKEAALLVENNSYKQLDKLIVVTAPLELRIARITNRDPFRSTLEIQKIIDSQSTDAEKINVADFTVLNDEKHLLIPQIIAIHHKLKKGST